MAQRDQRPLLQTYDGRGDVEQWCDYARDVIAVAAITDDHFADDEYVVKYLVTRLAPGAAHDWVRAQRRLNQNQQYPWVDANDFFASLCQHFTTGNRTENARRSIAHLKQRGPVSAYVARFNALSLQVDNFNPDGEGKYWFVEGLKPRLRHEIIMRGVQTLREAMNLASILDGPIFQEMQRHGMQPVHPVNTGPTPMELGYTQAAADPAAGPAGCWICGKPHHTWTRCSRRSSHKCEKCGRLGHPGRACRHG
jgi:hypothetical protein